MMLFTRRAVSSHLRFSRGAGVTAQRSSLLRLRARGSSTSTTTATTASSPSSAAAASLKSAAAAESSTSTATASTRVPVAASLAAALAGVVTVSAAAAVTERWTAKSVPPYSAAGQRFDQTTFAGRFSRMLLQCDPRLLCYTEAQVLQAKEWIETYHVDADRPSVDEEKHSDRALWEARRLVESALNDQGQFIPPPFRLSGYISFNGPVCVAMVAAQSTPALLFWSWANQSQNALVNYFNRNTSGGELSHEVLVKSYAAAVGSALAVALGLATAIQKRYPPAQAKQLLRWVAFPSAVVASSLNCYIVRSPEIAVGVPLQNARGETVAVSDGHGESVSQVAAARGVYATTASRAILQAPVYFVPPVLLAAIPPLRNYLARAPRHTVPVTTYLLLTCFGVGLPATVAIFPQISTIAAADVEERFQHLRDPQTDQPYEVFYYNKGL